MSVPNACKTDLIFLLRFALKRIFFLQNLHTLHSAPVVAAVTILSRETLAIHPSLPPLGIVCLGLSENIVSSKSNTILRIFFVILYSFFKTVLTLKGYAF